MFSYDLWEIWNRINGVVAMQHLVVSSFTDNEILVSLSPSTWKGKVIYTDSLMSKIKKHILSADWVEPSLESNLENLLKDMLPDSERFKVQEDQR